MNKQNRKRLAIGSISLFTLLGIGGGIITSKLINSKTIGDYSLNTNDSNIGVTTTNTNVNIKYLFQTNNFDGTITLTYSFTVTPETANRNQVRGELFFNEETEDDVDDYLSFEIDNQNKVFSITKKQDFSTQATLRLISVSRSNVYTDVLIDCYQRFLGFNDVGEKNYVVTLTDENSFDLEAIKDDLAEIAGVNNISEKYTIPTTSTYEVESESLFKSDYVYTDDKEEISRSGLRIKNTYQLRSLEFEDEFTLDDLKEVANTDSYLMEEENIQAFENSNYFGILLTYGVTYKFEDQYHYIYSTINIIADINEFTFGEVITSIDTETDSVIFNQDMEEENVERTYSLQKGFSTDSTSYTGSRLTRYEESDWYYLTDPQTLTSSNYYRVETKISVNDQTFKRYNTVDGSFVQAEDDLTGIFVFYTGKYLNTKPVEDEGIIKEFGYGLYLIDADYLYDI